MFVVLQQVNNSSLYTSGVILAVDAMWSDAIASYGLSLQVSLLHGHPESDLQL